MVEFRLSHDIFKLSLSLALLRVYYNLIFTGAYIYHAYIYIYIIYLYTSIYIHMALCVYIHVMCIYTNISTLFQHLQPSTFMSFFSRNAVLRCVNTLQEGLYPFGPCTCNSPSLPAKYSDVSWATKTHKPYHKVSTVTSYKYLDVPGTQ